MNSQTACRFDNKLKKYKFTKQEIGNFCPKSSEKFDPELEN